MKKTIALAFFACLGLIACEKDKALAPNVNSGDCFEQSYYYNIRPIIETSCKTHQGPGTGCHDAWIDNYSNITVFIQQGTWYSEIFVDKTMPEMPNAFNIDSLTDAELKVMQCWLDQGYPEN